MDNDLKNANGGDAGTESREAQENAKSARIKRMRSWMGIKGAGTWGGHADNNEPLLPGEGHSGWNR